jgi:DNA-binding transcriptional LysR family regulator
VHKFLGTVPFDLYELALFFLVVKQGSFTRAAQLAGLTQSAITRQVKAMETALGLKLLERTTRSVRLTPAGEFLFHEATRLLGDVERSLKHLSEEFGGARKEIRVGVSRSIGLAYLPGFFHANLRKFPDLNYRVSSLGGSDIVGAIESAELDVGVLCPPRRLPATLSLIHCFEDAFALIGPAGCVADLPRLKSKARLERLREGPWLLIDERSRTGELLRSWMEREELKVEPAMQLDSFDLIINLVGLGMGLSFVPIRALALYNHRRRVSRVPMPRRFSRKLVVVVRKRRQMPEHIQQFVEKVLF